MKNWGIVMTALAVMLGGGIAFAAIEKSAAPAAKTPSIRAEKQESDSGGPSGKVVETMNTGGYTYICLEKNGKNTWVAVPEMKVTVGSKMTFLPGQIMTDFKSKSLNRTFDRIVFSGGPASGGGPGAATGMTGGQPHGGSTSKVAALEKGARIEKASAANAYTVAELYAKRTALNKKTVAVKGKVVKVSEGIMQRNWIHLQDGSGDPRKGTHNLVVTSQDLPAVGDIVTVTGLFAKDKDFGAGYLYKAIVENAKVQK